MSRSNIDDATCTNSPNSAHYSYNTHSFNSIVNRFSVTDERSEILGWLSPLEPRIRHQDIRIRRADSVGEWLLQSDKFQRWCNGAGEDGPEKILFCSGDPAVGKTYFSSLVVDRLCDEAKKERIAVACFYVDFAAREEQSPTNMLGSLLKQIVGGLERIPVEISQTFKDCKKVIGGRGLQVVEIVRMLQAVTSLQRTFICVDALDECLEEHRPEVLHSLRQILENSPNTRIFLAGRPHVQGEIEGYLRVGASLQVLCVKPNGNDILEYIRMRLSKDTSLRAMDSGLEAEIIEGISENIPETFLLISLTMDAILRETTAYGRRRKLRAMTDVLDLKGIYGTTIKRIQESGGEKTRLGMAALMWISHSERLLQLDELLHALAVEIGSTDINSESIPSVETLLSCCLGLVVVDRETSTVRLIHSTLQEYLHNYPNLFGAVHSIMAETCLTYLNFQTTKEVSPTLSAPPQSTVLLKYSSLYWGVHARREISMNVVALALKLFGQIETHISTKLLLADLISRTGRYKGDIPVNSHLVGFTGLHCASVFGIVKIATTLIGRPNCDLNKRDFLGITPLIWAAICGQVEVAKLLLERQTIIPDKPDKYFRRTALSWAAWKGHEDIVKLLLGRASARPGGSGGWWGKTFRAMNVVLGKRFVNPNWPDKYGQTPLSLASEEGHSGVVKLLLGRRDVNSDAADGYGRTPLLWASSKGQEAVVKLLVERQDVNIDRPDKSGEAPLLSAAGCGYEVIVGLLLGRKDAESGILGKYCQTLLFLAAKKGHDGIVRLLLGRDDVNPDVRDIDGLTPLSLAAGHGCNEVVKLLLRREDVNSNSLDNRVRTPLSWAAGNGHEGVVKLLLGWEDVNPHMPDNNGWTPLSWAARNGHGGVVKLLLEREDISPNTPDNDGWTPLSWAAKKGHDGVVRLLLGWRDIKPSMPDNGGRTPLWWATEHGHDRVVKLLLGREDINPNMSDNGGLAPLWLAAGNGHVGIVKLLLGREDVNRNVSEKGRKRLRLWAFLNRHEGVVELLWGPGDVNRDMPNNHGLLPLTLVSQMRH